ncbi:MAG: hypothetical protein NZ578_16710 [Candidatus Binatia bacterium]|nr:hypothetical protein [Candidatus Binatia bacterium]
MAHAYTPGLRVTPDTTVRKSRLLPIPGEVLVAVGQQVAATTVVAQTALPGRIYPVNVAHHLGIAPAELPSYMVKREGEAVQKGEPIAQNRPLIKWLQTQVRAPVSGVIESISTVTGQVFLREPPTRLHLPAYIEGTVVEVLPAQGVVVETRCAFIQGIFGVGGETSGVLSLAVSSPDEELTAHRLHASYHGHIVVGGALVRLEAFLRAREIGVKALVVGGVHDRDLKELLGGDLGVAITGSEQIGLTLIITEGFGRIPMARRTFDLLAAKAGQQASCNGATQIRAGVIRPEVIIPLEPPCPTVSPASAPRSRGAGIREGAMVRVIREPYFGLLARVKALPAELQRIPTESTVRVLIATLPDGQDVVIPRANVEMIEE